MAERRKREPKSVPAPARTLIVVRPDRADAADAWSRAAPARYAGIDSHDVAVCVPTAAQAEGIANGLVLDAAALAALGLYAHPQHWRRCRDYALYAARQAFPGYTNYWFACADLRIAGDPAACLGQFAANPAHLLAAKLGARPPGWGWGGKMRLGGAPAHGCAWPLLRLSAAAADALLHARQLLSADPAFATPADWPNDEAFAPTTLAGLAMPMEDFNDAGRDLYSEESLAAHQSFDEAWLAARPPDNRLYHPVRDFAAWTNEAETLGSALPPRARSLENPVGLKSIDAALMLDRLGHSCLRTPHYAPAAFAPLMLAENFWRTRPWAAAGTEPAEGGRQKACQAALQRRFGPTETARPIGTAHLAICTVGRNSLGSVRATDWALGPATPVAHLPRVFALPYAYDLPARDLLLTIHANLAETLGRPFLYAAQRELARIVARINLADLPRLYGGIDAKAAPVLVFSVGRTGSTLLQKLIGCVTPRSLSEPDTLTQLAESGPAFAALSPPERRAAIYYALAPLFQIRLPGEADGRCVIKLRSQANGLAQEIAATFPAAKYVFMLREKRAWARSTFRSFGMNPQAAARRLLQALRALRHLQTSFVDVSLIFYEDVIADPAGTTARLTGADPAADPALAARIAAIIGADSQAGHSLSRVRTSQMRDGEEEWLTHFETSWAEIRPEPVLRHLNLNY